MMPGLRLLLSQDIGVQRLRGLRVIGFVHRQTIYNYKIYIV